MLQRTYSYVKAWVKLFITVVTTFQGLLETIELVGDLPAESGSEEHPKVASASIERDEEHNSETHEGTRNGKKKQIKKLIEGVYEQFLEVPVPIVLAGMWVLGAALIVLCALVLYLCWLLLAAMA